MWNQSITLELFPEPTTVCFVYANLIYLKNPPPLEVVMFLAALPKIFTFVSIANIKSRSHVVWMRLPYCTYGVSIIGFAYYHVW